MKVKNTYTDLSHRWVSLNLILDLDSKTVFQASLLDFLSGKYVKYVDIYKHWWHIFDREMMTSKI